jgi:hypothetical protein
MSRLTYVILAVSVSLLPASLAAQRCMGSTSFEDRRAQVIADMSVTTGAQSVGGGIAVGSRGAAGPFASVGYGKLNDKEVDATVSQFSLMGGAAVWSRGRAQLCPFVSGQVFSDMDVGNRQTLSAKVYGLGVSLGTTLRVRPTLDIVPFASAAILTQANELRLPDGLVAAWSDRYRDLSLGAGFVLGNVFTVRPSATLISYRDQATVSYELRVSSSFGRLPPRVVLGPNEGSLDTVWMDKREGLYYCSRSRRYGATANGSFMTERQALAAGANPEYGKRC